MTDITEQQEQLKTSQNYVAKRPSDKAIILCLMKNWPNATMGMVCDWIIASSESIQSKP